MQTHEYIAIFFLTDHIHLAPVSQQIVAGRMMRWLDRSNDPVAGKSTEDNMPPPLPAPSKALLDSDIIHHKIKQEEVGDAKRDVDNNDVFEDSAKKFLKNQEHEKRLADAAEAATAAAGSQQDGGMRMVVDATDAHHSAC